jgi:hypothetical protein
MTAILGKLSKAPQPLPLPLMPEMAGFLAGKTIVLDANPLHIQSIQLEFDETPEASIKFTFSDGTQSPWAAIGLDGIFRLTSGVGIDRAIRSMMEIENQPVGIVGEWIDAQTFIIDYDTLTNRYRYRMQMHFNGNDVAFDLSERVYGDQISFSGQMQSP